MIHSHLTYCIPIYSCTSNKNLTKIEKAQKKAIRTISKAKYNAHTKDLFNAAKIMPFKTLIKYQQSLLVHSIYHKYCPPSLHSSWSTVGERNNTYALRNAADYFVPQAVNEQLKKLPYFALPKLWNEICDMKYVPNPTTFKLFFKNLLLSSNE
jgi:hypothetical protein